MSARPIGRGPRAARRARAYAALAAVAIPVSLRGPASTLSFSWISSIDLWDAPAQEQNPDPSLAGNEERE